MNEPARQEAAPRPARPPLDVRVGSSTNALQPISSAERSLAAGPRQWLALAAIASAAVAADQLTKGIVSSALSLGEEAHVAGPLSLHHVQNSGIAFGLFARSTGFVIVLTALAVTWMLVFFARSGQRHPVLPVALGFVLGGSVANLLDRVRLGHVTDFLDLALVAGVQPGRHLHRRGRGHSLRRARRAERPRRRPRLGDASLPRS